MLFWNAPMRTEIVHRTNAPVVPSAPMDAPRAAMRNPGFANAMTNPSHQVIALRSCLSSTSACAMDPPSPPSGQQPADVPIGTDALVPWVTDGRQHGEIDRPRRGGRKFQGKCHRGASGGARHAL